MPGITRVGDAVGPGAITTTANNFAQVEGSYWVLLGDPVSNHGTAPHDAATMSSASTFANINGTAVCFAGNTATCGHAAAGSGNMRVSQ